MAQGKLCCPFCNEELERRPPQESVWFSCLGEFPMDYTSCERYINQTWENPQDRLVAWTKLGYGIAHIRLFHPREAYQRIPPIDFVSILKDTMLPTPAQQANLAIEFIGICTKFLGNSLFISHKSKEFVGLQYWIGALSDKTVYRILEELLKQGFIINNSKPSDSYENIELTISGWKEYERLQRPNKESKYVFLAMKFVKEQQEFLKEKLSPMLKDLGLELRLLPEIPSKENLIDNKLRVAIRQSRLLICDLTHGNQGAYWEAGYAEGLGLPVIYIGNQEILDSEDKEIKPHFDVNHQNIFSWKQDDQESIQEFLSKVKAQIEMFL